MKPADFGSASQQSESAWFGKPNFSWNTADKVQAKECLEAHWKRICGDFPAGVTRRPEVGDVTDRLLRSDEWLYRGNSPEAFLNHCTLHLRTLLYVLLREQRGVVDEDGCAEAHVRLSNWLQEDRLPNDQLVMVAAIADREAGAAGAAAHLWLFCETALRDVINDYALEGSAWNYLKIAFERHVRKNRAAGAARRSQTRRASASDSGGAEVIAASRRRQEFESEERSSTNRTGDCGAKRARETLRFLTLWEKEIARREGGKRQKTASRKPSGERMQYRALTKCYQQWPEGLQAEHGNQDHSVAVTAREPDLSRDGVGSAAAAGIYKRVAVELKITEDNVKVLIHRARLRVRDGLRRYPAGLEIKKNQNDWRLRVRLNRFAMWDTLVAVSCTPPDLGHLSSTVTRVAECDDLSDVVRLTADCRESRPTALCFPREYTAGERAIGELRLNQLLVRAFANDRSVEEWIVVRAHGLDAEVRVALLDIGRGGPDDRDALPLAVRIDGKLHPLPFTLTVPPGKTPVPLEFDTSHATSRLVGLEFVPEEVVGGDTTRAVLTMGARLGAQVEGQALVTGLLPIAPAAPIDGVLSNHAPCVQLQPRWQADQARIAWNVQTNPVADKIAVKVTAGPNPSSPSHGGAHVTGTLTLCPPVLLSLKLVDERSKRRLGRVRAGGVAGGQLTFDRTVARDTEVTVSTTHDGIHIQSPVIVPAGRSAVNIRLEVADDALPGTARISASANGTRLSTSVDVTRNRVKLSFEPRTLVHGAVATGTITCEGSVLKDTRFELRLAGEEAGGPVRASGGAPLRPLVSFSKRTVKVPAGERVASFEVHTDVRVKRAISVVVVAIGLGIEASASLRLLPQRKRG